MARETWVQSQVESYQRLKKWYLMPPCLTLSIIRYGSRVKQSNPGKEQRPPLHIGVVAIEKGAFGLPSTMVANFTYYLTNCWKDKEVHTFPKGICPKVNVIARLEFEFANYDSVVHQFNHYATRAKSKRERGERERERNRKKETKLACLFNEVSIFLGYLMPNSSFQNSSDAI